MFKISASKQAAALKTLFLILTLALFPKAFYAQNGLPLNVLQEDPYLESGNIEAEKERRAQEAKEGKTDSSEEGEYQYTNPDDPTTFYNAQNWDYGDVDYSQGGTEQTTPGPNPEVNSSDSSAESAEKKEQTEEEKNAQAEVDMLEEEGGPLPSDDLKAGKTADIPFKDVKITFGAGWMPGISLPILDNSVEYYFRNTMPFYFGAASAELHFDAALRRREKSSLGLGLNASWKYTDKETEYYKLSIHEFYFTGLFVVRFALGDYNVLNLHAGGGAVWYHNVVYEYANGYITDPLDWIFPQASAGADFTIFLAKHWGLGAGADFYWPFLIKEAGAIDPSVTFRLLTSLRF